MNGKLAKTIVFIIIFIIVGLLGQFLGGVIFLSLAEVADDPTPFTLFLYWEKGLAWQFSLPYRLGVIASILILLFLSLSFLYVLLLPQKRELHGSSRFAKLHEIRKAKLFSPSQKDPGILIGKYKDQFLTWSGKQFAFLAAPTRSGKGVGIVVPNCLHYPDSLVVFDPKLENFKLTAGYRQKVLKQEVYLFTPSAPDLCSHCWNPLSYISRDPIRTIGDALNVANIIYTSSDDKENAKFFAEMAQKLFVGIVLYMIEFEKRFKGKEGWLEDYTPTLTRLQKLTTPKGEYQHFADWIKKVVVPDPYFSDECKENLLSYANTSEQTGASILSSLIAPLSVFNDGVVSKITCRDDFDLRDIRKKRMSIYIGINPDDIAKFSRLINLFFSQLISVNTKELPEDNPKLKYQVLLLIDEFAALGKVDIIEKAVAYIAGYNLRLFPIFQNMSQLNRLYTKEGARTLSTNFECHIIYPPRDNNDAKEYSEIIGYETFKAKGTSRHKSGFGSSSISISDQKRAVMNPDELRTMPTTECIISMTGIRPIKAEKIVYYTDPFFEGKTHYATPNIPSIFREAEKSPPKNTMRVEEYKNLAMSMISPTLASKMSAPGMHEKVMEKINERATKIGEALAILETPHEEDEEQPLI